VLVSQSIAAGGDQSPMNDFAASQISTPINGTGSYPFIPYDIGYEYSWAEQKYQAGEFTALVARYGNIPFGLKKSLDQLLAAGYGKSLFLSNLFEASLLLLSSGIIPNLGPLAEPCKQLYGEYSSTIELQRASSFISLRKADDIVVLALKSGQILGSMTLYPFSKKEDMPSLSYLSLGKFEALLPDVPAVEAGRLVKSAADDDQNADSCDSLLKAVWIAVAFLVARDFLIKSGLLEDPKSYICGDTHGSLLASLQHFFPIEIVPSFVRADILDEKSEARDVAIYFLQRQVLGSFKSADDFIDAINEIESLNPKIAFRILELVTTGLKQLGIPSLKNFDAEKFKINFFYFTFQHERTRHGFDRLEKLVRRMLPNRSMKLQ
jgi:hypothetical protein